jgi:hypothetical protein
MFLLRLGIFFSLNFIRHSRFNSLNKRFFNSLNYLFSQIKLLAQFLHLVTFCHQHNAPFLNLHGDAAAGLKSRLFEQVTFKVQSGIARISGGDYGFSIGVAYADILDFKTVLGFGKGDFKINIIFSQE